MARIIKKLNFISYLWHQMQNTGGQMAIFIALIFQILFVFFAMIVNIGLTVHDKINLQNSVDLAAYYAASKQAEILNAIAHVNYQIRQDYKLLVYRMRVLGGLGYLEHPSYIGKGAVPVADVPWNLPVVGDILYTDQPAICIQHQMWDVSGETDNLCKSMTQVIPALPRLDPGPPFIPTYGLNLSASQATEEARRQIGEKCQRAAVLNWYYAATINLAFKLDVARRRAVIRELGRAIASKDSLDLDGALIKDGTKKTLQKNLTRPNLSSLGTFAFYNSLSSGDPVNPETGLPKWLSPIGIEYSIPYIYHRIGDGNSCTNTVSELVDLNNIPPGVIDPTGNLRGLILNPPTPASDYFAIRGVEKNPWYMAYVGVYAETSPRKPFAPFGTPFKLKARAYAKPFGGRIGPWETRTWGRDSPTSDKLALPVDELAVPRVDRIRRSGDLRVDKMFFPNYARFPGDKLGLKSVMALSHARFLNKERELKIGDYDLPLTNLLNPQSKAGDAIAFDPRNPTGGLLRLGELGAIAPDLFDATYYSIDTKFSYYLEAPLLTAKPEFFIPDLGSQPGKILTSRDHVISGNSTEFNEPAVPGAKRFYLIKSPDNVLTGWTQPAEADYTFPFGKFGRCDSTPGENNPKLPGNCIIGGRSGYSVKLVSADYIFSANHNLGGEGSAPGPLIQVPNDQYFSLRATGEAGN